MAFVRDMYPLIGEVARSRNHETSTTTLHHWIFFGFPSHRGDVRRNRNSTALHLSGVRCTNSKVCLNPSFCYWPHFGCYSLVPTGPAEQVPDGEVASGDKATSGNKVSPVYLYRHHFFPGRRKTSSSITQIRPDSNRKPGLRLPKHRKSLTGES